jgi:hypothetical protein
MGSLSDASREYCQIGTGDPIEAENLVEFRLLYQGELLLFRESLKGRK